MCLKNLCVDSDDNRRRVAGSGGVEAVVKAMNDHPSAELLLEHACMMLTHLCTTNVDKKKEKESEERRLVIERAGGVEAITNIMTGHPTVLGLLRCSCWALQTLCVGDEGNKKRVVESGGVEAVVKAMNDHPFCWNTPVLCHRICLRILMKRIASCVRNEEH